MIGPSYTFEFDRHSSIDFKARVGEFYFKDSENFEETNPNPNDPVLSGTSYYTRKSIGYSLAIAYRFQFARHWSTILSTEYYNGKSGHNLKRNESLNTLLLNGGVCFQF